MKVLWIVGGVFFAVGLGLAAGGAAVWRSNARFEAAAGKAEGQVVDLISYRSDKSTMYKPMVQFQTEDGREISFSGATGSSSPSYARGDKVPVLYDRATPENAQIDSFMERAFVVVIPLGMGLVFGGVGGGLLAHQVKQRRVEALDAAATRLAPSERAALVRSVPALAALASQLGATSTGTPPRANLPKRVPAR